MAAGLPTDSAITKSVDTFGNGTYDSMSDDMLHGENDEETSDPSLPGIPNHIHYEPYISYPQSESSQEKHATLFFKKLNNVLAAHIYKTADSSLPNDGNINPRGVTNPNSNTEGGVLAPTDVTSVVSQDGSELPSDSDNPAARSDYYDDMQTGAMPIQLNSIEDMFAKEDSGAYVSSESLPTSIHNDKYTDNTTSPLGNSDSGLVIEDQNVPYGFPTDPYKETSDTPKSNDGSIPGGTLIASRKFTMNRKATDIKWVESLTSDFLKAHGKKNITRRAVTAFLQENGHGDRQYIASDIVRCLKHEHNIIIPDVLDIFPIKTASGSVDLNAVHSSILSMEIDYLNTPEVSKTLGDCAVNIASTIALLKKCDR